MAVADSPAGSREEGRGVLILSTPRTGCWGVTLGVISSKGRGSAPSLSLTPHLCLSEDKLSLGRKRRNFVALGVFSYRTYLVLFRIF
jgi:hypothetical protein